MKVLELFSGIGGMHLALKESGVTSEIIASIDINPIANKVYKHNFPNTLLLNRNIQSLTSKYINKLGVNGILMSPPCQPFTRNGLQEDINDARTVSFLHILKLLPDLANIKYILIENVKGFETSAMRTVLIEALKDCKFLYQEFILSPSQFGVPNTRHRYYCLAKKSPLVFKFPTQALIESLPNIPDVSPNIPDVSPNRTIGELLDKEANIQEYLIPDDVLLKRATSIDICYLDSARSCCFTKAYGRYVTGTGSVLTIRTKDQVDCVYRQLKELHGDEYLGCIKSLQLRFFTPREVCRLMCFPETFMFPDNVTNRQKYMVLGNSINIKVVSELIKLLVE